MGEQRQFRQGAPSVRERTRPRPGGPRPVDQDHLSRPDRPLQPDEVARLQRSAGNRAVARLLGRWGSDLPVQRQPVRELPPRTKRWQEDNKQWEENQKHGGEAVMRRTTTIEATGWAEREPAPPRISYRREVELETADGITVYLDIRGTVKLQPGTKLPADEAAALAMRGREVLSQRTLRVDGGDVISVNEYSPHTVGGLSFGAVAKAVMPDYAQLPLTPAQQQAAILAMLRRLPRRPKTAPTEAPPAGDDRSTAGIAADVATDFIPFIGELKDLYRAVTGTDPVTGEKLKWWERALAFLGAIPIIGKLGKMVGKGIRFLVEGDSAGSAARVPLLPPGSRTNSPVGCTPARRRNSRRRRPRPGGWRPARRRSAVSPRPADWPTPRRRLSNR